MPTKLVSPEPYEGDTFTLEGHELRIIEQGRTDSPDSTSLHVPSIGLIVAGDVVYNQCRMYVGDTTPESRKNWIAALDRLAALNPAIVVAGHKKPGAPDSPSTIWETKRYLRRLRSGAENRDLRPGVVRSDDGAIPALGSESVVVDVRIPTGLIGQHEYERIGKRRMNRVCLELESSMSSVQVEQKSYEMPPREGISIAHFLTVADVERSARYYEKVFDARILSLGDGNAPGYLQLANIWMILNVGGGPTPDKPTVTLSVPDPNHINSFMNFRVADIRACYELWKSRGAEFITEPIPKYGEVRCYIRDPDGYIIEVGQSTDLTYG